MNTILWEMPVAPTAIDREPNLSQFGRGCEINFTFENDNAEIEAVRLRFTGIEIFRCTYLTSLGSVASAFMDGAYGRVISIENSPWLADIKNFSEKYPYGTSHLTGELRHLAILFDDGPCYEFICRGFVVNPDESLGSRRP